MGVLSSGWNSRITEDEYAEPCKKCEKERDRLQTLIDDIQILMDHSKKRAEDDCKLSHTYFFGRYTAYHECMDMIQYHLNLLTGECD